MTTDKPARPEPYMVDDPVVVGLARFLSRAALTDGRTTTGLVSPTTDLLAQAVVNFLAGLVWSADDGKWIDRATWESLPDLGDVAVEVVGSGVDGDIVRMTQRSTGVSALGMTHAEAWAELRRKVVSGG